MREELVEDKYLTVYRTVSKQAEDMMQSLEKVFNQCTTFVHEMHGKYGSGKGSASSSASSDLTSEGEAYSLQAHLNTFLALNKSLHQKSSKSEIAELKAHLIPCLQSILGRILLAVL